MRAVLPRLVVVCLLALAPGACSGNPGCGGIKDPAACTRVLFIGNSYTYVNDLPSVFASLAGSGGHRVETGVLAEAGWTLAQHVGSPDTRTKLRSARWNLVVLQEQSEIPSVERLRQGQMYPAARTLVRMVRDAGAQPLFFVTWGHRDGWPQDGLPDYAGMQGAVDDGYLAIAGEQHAALAPVGLAWSVLVRQKAGTSLWQADGSHPTTTGTYLAACVFYATVFKHSPRGLAYHSDLSGAEAARLQDVAGAIALEIPPPRPSPQGGGTSLWLLDSPGSWT
jgi:hypothetical protein